MNGPKKTGGMKHKDTLQTNYTFQNKSQKSIKINLLKPSIRKDESLCGTIYLVPQEQANQSLIMMNQLMQIPILNRKNSMRKDSYESLYRTTQLQKHSRYKINQNLLNTQIKQEKPSVNQNSNNFLNNQLVKSTNSHFKSEPSMINVNTKKQESVKNYDQNSFKKSTVDNKLKKTVTFDKNFNLFQQEFQQMQIQQTNKIINNKPEQNILKKVLERRQVKNQYKKQQFIQPQQKISNSKVISPIKYNQMSSSQIHQNGLQKFKLSNYFNSNDQKNQQINKKILKSKQVINSPKNNAFSNKINIQDQQRQLNENRQLYRQIKKDNSNLQNQKIMPLLKLQILKDIEKAQRSLNQLHKMISQSDDNNSNTQLIMYYQIRRTIRDQVIDNLEATIQDVKPFYKVSTKYLNQPRRNI